MGKSEPRKVKGKGAQGFKSRKLSHSQCLDPDNLTVEPTHLIAFSSLQYYFFVLPCTQLKCY